MHVSELRGDLQDLRNEVVLGASDAEHAGELGDDQHQRDPIDVADEDRPGEEVGDRPEPEGAGDDEHNADHDGEQRRAAEPLLR